MTVLLSEFKVAVGFCIQCCIHLNIVCENITSRRYLVTETFLIWVSTVNEALSHQKEIIRHMTNDWFA